MRSAELGTCTDNATPSIRARERFEISLVPLIHMSAPSHHIQFGELEVEGGLRPRRQKR